MPKRKADVAIDIDDYETSDTSKRQVTFESKADAARQRQRDELMLALEGAVGKNVAQDFQGLAATLKQDVKGKLKLAAPRSATASIEDVNEERRSNELYSAVEKVVGFRLEGGVFSSDGVTNQCAYEAILACSGKSQIQQFAKTNPELRAKARELFDDGMLCDQMDKALVCVKHEDAIKLGLSFYSLFGYTSTLFTNLEWKNTILTKKSEDLRQAMSNAVNASARSAGPPQPPWGYGDRQGRTACGKFVRLLETLASTHVPVTGERKIEWQVVQQEGVFSQPYYVRAPDGSVKEVEFFQEEGGVQSASWLMEMWEGELCYDLHCLLVRIFFGSVLPPPATQAVQPLPEYVANPRYDNTFQREFALKSASARDDSGVSKYLKHNARQYLHRLVYTMYHRHWFLHSPASCACMHALEKSLQGSYTFDSRLAEPHMKFSLLPQRDQIGVDAEEFCRAFRHLAQDIESGTLQARSKALAEKLRNAPRRKGGLLKNAAAPSTVLYVSGPAAFRDWVMGKVGATQFFAFLKRHPKAALVGTVVLVAGAVILIPGMLSYLSATETALATSVAAKDVASWHAMTQQMVLRTYIGLANRVFPEVVAVPVGQGMTNHMSFLTGVGNAGVQAGNEMASAVASVTPSFASNWAAGGRQIAQGVVDTVGPRVAEALLREAAEAVVSSTPSMATSGAAVDMEVDRIEVPMVQVLKFDETDQTTYGLEDVVQDNVLYASQGALDYMASLVVNEAIPRPESESFQNANALGYAKLAYVAQFTKTRELRPRQVPSEDVPGLFDANLVVEVLKRTDPDRWYEYIKTRRETEPEEDAAALTLFKMQTASLGTASSFAEAVHAPTPRAPVCFRSVREIEAARRRAAHF